MIKKISLLIYIFFAGIVLFSFCKNNNAEASMVVTSPEFKNNGYIPKKYTGLGEDINPPLAIEGIPAEAKSIALIVDDPDAPMGTWVHWIVFDMPIISKVSENSVPGKQGLNDFGKTSYGGPCPPWGVHRYFFKVYALDIVLGLEEGISKNMLEKAMEGHILEQSQLIGLYKKN